MLDLSWQKAVDTFDIRIAAGLLVAYIVLDAVFALYTLSVTERKAAQAAHYSFLYYFVMALGVISYVQNFLYIIPAAIGSWLGTYIIVKRSKKLSDTGSA